LRDLRGSWPDGGIKLLLLGRLLGLRRRHAELFQRGSHEVIEVERGDPHLIAFRRCLGENSVVIVVPTHFSAMTDGGRHWPAQLSGTLRLGQPAAFVNILTGEAIDGAGEIDLQTMSGDLPFLVLAPEENRRASGLATAFVGTERAASAGDFPGGP
jgi:(1->4)-alpha-D-glucan 1-alpha-D-glucosylmutase